MNWKGEMIYPSDVASDSRVELGEIERQRLSESRELLHRSFRNLLEAQYTRKRVNARQFRSDRNFAERGTRLSRLKRTLRMMLLIRDAGTARIRAEFSR